MQDYDSRRGELDPQLVEGAYSANFAPPLDAQGEVREVFRIPVLAVDDRALLCIPHVYHGVVPALILI